MNLCPVCGYRGLERPPADFLICPCCGTEFGYDDYRVTHDQLRARWRAAGLPWFSDFTRPPAGWNPYVQLLRAGLAHSTGTGARSYDAVKALVPSRRFVRPRSLVYA